MIQAEYKYLAKALYDYDASAPGELSVKEDDVLHAFDAEDGWLLVQTEKDGGKAGFVPLNYVEEVRFYLSITYISSNTTLGNCSRHKCS